MDAGGWLSSSCHRCGLPGYWKATCTSDVLYFACRRPGHMARHCAFQAKTSIKARRDFRGETLSKGVLAVCSD